jgi:hypothetical protein
MLPVRACPAMSLSMPEALDPLVAQTADRIAHAINDLKRALDSRDSAWAHAHGEVELTLASHAFVLSIVPGEKSQCTQSSRVPLRRMAMRLYPLRPTPPRTGPPPAAAQTQSL